MPASDVDWVFFTDPEFFIYAHCLLLPCWLSNVTSLLCENFSLYVCSMSGILKPTFCRGAWWHFIISNNGMGVLFRISQWRRIVVLPASQVYRDMQVSLYWYDITSWLLLCKINQLLVWDSLNHFWLMFSSLRFSSLSILWSLQPPRQIFSAEDILWGVQLFISKSLNNAHDFGQHMLASTDGGNQNRKEKIGRRNRKREKKRLKQ